MLSMECLEQTGSLPVALFVACCTLNLIYTIVVRKLPFVEAIQVLLGTRSHEKNLVDWCLIAVTLAGPLVLWLYLQQTCSAAL
ncbi:hypothetical protein NBRC116594_04870 [Shimia sp. NS0008-38b]|uniref:hypothetical protein n=1 Tax=Shimia sp. NS0008-38b TaxID=3127653 RepID=UPI00310436AB